jgi:GT2 family glycosyltransferase
VSGASAAGPGAHVVAVVVTNRGPTPRLRSCLGSVACAGGVAAVVVVDNSEPAASRWRREPACYGPGVTGLVTMPNRGYGAAANRGIEWAVAHVPAGRRLAVALLNDDVEVGSGWLPPLLTALDADPGVGAVQPKVLFLDRDVVNSAGVDLDRTHAGFDVGFGEPDGPSWGEARRITAFTGGAVLLRGAFLDDVGGFDERYFLYYEDVDLALRGAERGWSYRCEPRAVVRHAFGDTTSGIGTRRRWLQERNRLWCAARFAPWSTSARAVWLSVRRLRHPPRAVHARALASGLAGLPTRWVERAAARAPRRPVSSGRSSAGGAR